MKLPHRLGVFPLGHENVELWLDPLDGGDAGGGWFVLQGDDGARPSIHLLIDAGTRWGHVLHLILHETREFLCARHGWRFRESMAYNGNSAAQLFVYDHQQGASMDADQGCFLANALPVLERAHRKMQKGKKV